MVWIYKKRILLFNRNNPDDIVERYENENYYYLILVNCGTFGYSNNNSHDQENSYDDMMGCPVHQIIHLRSHLIANYYSFTLLMILLPFKTGFKCWKGSWMQDPLKKSGFSYFISFLLHFIITGS